MAAHGDEHVPNVNEFLRTAVNEMPDTFVEKEQAFRFLDEQADIQEKERLAIQLLEAVAHNCECHATWETLVKNRLAAAEKAMRYLLPAHRDHILHSAHLYLLGLALYLKMLRPDGALLAVIADTHWRDAQALFGSPQLSYSCLPSLLLSGESFDDAKRRLPRAFDIPIGDLDRLLTECPACSPSERATGAAGQLGMEMLPYLDCCGPGSHIIEAVNTVANAVARLDTGSLCICDHCPHTVADVDEVFRRRWGLAAILHDSAYPMELASRQIADYVGESVGKLGCSVSPCKASFGITLNCLCDFVTLPLVQNICSERFNNEMFADNSIRLLATNICHKLHVEYSPETLAHIMTTWLESGCTMGRWTTGCFQRCSCFGESTTRLSMGSVSVGSIASFATTTRIAG